MKELEWKDEYALGIPAIDLQHKRIFDCIISILAGPSADDRLRAEAEILKLLGLLQEHFTLEESMMRTLNYAELEPHIEEHRRFHADVHHLAERFLRHKTGVSGEAIKTVQKWLREHIMTSDKRYVDFFSSAALRGARGKRGAA
jgi:hemerythrin-like metal-binding protein